MNNNKHTNTKAKAKAKQPSAKEVEKENKRFMRIFASKVSLLDMIILYANFWLNKPLKALLYTFLVTGIGTILIVTLSSLIKFLITKTL